MEFSAYTPSFPCHPVNFSVSLYNHKICMFVWIKAAFVCLKRAPISSIYRCWLPHNGAHLFYYFL